jgi:hypothetical protein
MELLALVYFLIAAIYLVFMVVTIQVFDRKGQSVWVGFFLSLMLPIIALVVALVMPYDQPVLEERKRRALIAQQRLEKLGPLEPEDEPPALVIAQTVFAIVLIASLLLSIAPIPPTGSAILGILATLSLLGLTVAILLPIPTPRQ